MNTPDRHFTKGTMKAPGCIWASAYGVIGISERLYVFDGPGAIGNANDLSPRSRRALAKHMIDLWTRFGAGETA